jgi:hypothetical protein
MAMRKGVFFTIMTLIILTFAIAYYKIGGTAQLPESVDTEVARVRVTVMSNYIDTFEQHATASLRTAGYFTLQNLSARIRNNGTYLSDMNASVRMCLLNGTTATNCLRQNQTINHSLGFLTSMALSNLSIATTYTINDIWVSEENPFEVVFWMNISYNITDPFASWTIESVVKAPVDIVGIEDPLFSYGAGTGQLTQTRSFSRTNVVGYQFTNTSFTGHYFNQSYIYIPSGRSVLQRYTGNLSNSSLCCGIESIIVAQYVTPALLNSSAPVANWSFVDYYFLQRNDPQFNFNCNSQAIASLKGINFPDHFVRLDQYHLMNVYGLNSSANYTCLP